MMRLGFIGPADADPAALQSAARLLVSDLDADAVLYLGADAALKAFIAGQPARGGQGVVGHRIADVAESGSPEDIGRVLRVLRGARILAKLRVVPRPPARSVEMIADRVVLVVHRKTDINEEDLINASVVVYGNGPELQFKRFGPRCFFSPGPLEQGKVGLLEESSDDGGVVLQAFELDGTMLWSEPVHGRGAKVMVSP
jgi:hypothetical protein